MSHPLLEESLEIKKMKMDLERFRMLEASFGNPCASFQSVHVAGTNGKGTVSCKIAAALQALGLKIGLFTSPHVISFHERIQINQIPISEEDAYRLLNKIQRAVPADISYFEALTLTAFLYFAEQKIDVAVLEVGMGGRLDATNIVTPLLSVITSIGLDHTQYLGENLAQIAIEKAGIIKPGIPVLLGPYAQPRDVFLKVAKEKQSPLYFIDAAAKDYEKENLEISLKALELLPFKFTENAFEMARCARLPCRSVEICPGVFFDVGHNPPALERVFEKISLTYPEKGIRVLAAFSQGKEIGEMLNVLEKKATFTHLTEARHPRTWRSADVEIKKNMELEVDFDRAFERAFFLSRRDDQILLVCGTFFMMKDALAKVDWVRAHG